MTEKSAYREYPPELLVAGLKTLLDVQETGPGLFQGARKPGGVGRVFGGQVIAQGLMAAIKTIQDEKRVHSLHAYFMRPGDEDHPIEYRVEADFDGGSFANRRVVALQQGKAILNMTASFQRPEDGYTHQREMPDVPPPDELISSLDYARAHSDEVPEQVLRFMMRPNPVEMRAVGAPPFFRRSKMAPVANIWFRIKAPLQASPDMHNVVLAFISDMALLSTSMLPHGLSWHADEIQTASLDHALWFHEDAPVDEWLLYSTSSPWTGHARGFNQGSVFTRAGRLVASVAQEGLIRKR